MVMASLRYSVAEESEDTLNSFTSPTECGDFRAKICFMCMYMYKHIYIYIYIYLYTHTSRRKGRCSATSGPIGIGTRLHLRHGGSHCERRWHEHHAPSLFRQRHAAWTWPWRHGRTSRTRTEALLYAWTTQIRGGRPHPVVLRYVREVGNSKTKAARRKTSTARHCFSGARESQFACRWGTRPSEERVSPALRRSLLTPSAPISGTVPVCVRPGTLVVDRTTGTSRNKGRKGRGRERGRGKYVVPSGPSALAPPLPSRTSSSHPPTLRWSLPATSVNTEWGSLPAPPPCGRGLPAPCGHGVGSGASAPTPTPRPQGRGRAMRAERWGMSSSEEGGLDRGIAQNESAPIIVYIPSSCFVLR